MMSHLYSFMGGGSNIRILSPISSVAYATIGPLGKLVYTDFTAEDLCIVNIHVACDGYADVDNLLETYIGELSISGHCVWKYLADRDQSTTHVDIARNGYEGMSATLPDIILKPGDVVRANNANTVARISGFYIEV